MKRPVILITAGPAYDRQFYTESRTLNKTYTSAVTAAGGLPIMNLDWNCMEEYIELADGCIFTGTHKFTPDPGLSLQEMQTQRKIQELKLMRAFIKTGKPAFGICQGMQQLNVACGGDLNRDFRLTDGVEHNLTFHPVKTVKGSLVHRLFGEEFIVNSFHNVRVQNLAPDLVATAVSSDGVIEAYEHKALPVFGFQFHPERMRGDFPDPAYAPNMQPLFDIFVQMCSKNEA